MASTAGGGLGLECQIARLSLQIRALGKRGEGGGRREVEALVLGFNSTGEKGKKQMRSEDEKKRRKKFYWVQN